MPAKAEFSWGDAATAGGLLFILWPWLMLVIDACFWIVTGSRAFPGITDARLIAAALWPIAWGVLCVLWSSV